MLVKELKTTSKEEVTKEDESEEEEEEETTSKEFDWEEEKKALTANIKEMISKEIGGLNPIETPVGTSQPAVNNAPLFDLTSGKLPSEEEIITTLFGKTK